MVVADEKEKNEGILKLEETIEKVLKIESDNKTINMKKDIEIKF